MFPEAHRKLSAELERLTSAAEATNAFVFDAWGLVWGYASFPDARSRELLFIQIKAVLHGLPTPLQRGARLDRIFTNLQPALYCCSFAAVYVLAVWPSEQANAFLLRRVALASLPAIESLTMLLPPPGGENPA